MSIAHSPAASAMPPEPADPSDVGPSVPSLAGDGPGATFADPERWVDEHGDYLFHFALSRVRDPGLAEDLVQDALLAALRGVDRYQGRSTERTWLAGILRNKLLDHFRKAGRETPMTDLEFFEDDERRAFDNPEFPGHWTREAGPQDWGRMGESMDEEAFWEAFQGCTRKLPDKVARVFVLREVDELPTEEICGVLAITPNNLWVMLHRARMALRRCLEENWFRKHGHELP
ncbi:MAG: sigma-70 family RNA polymerase sigma factor [Verrucomicrobiales bacterium]|nr:sigma-70 family RNA polymerase sigma factor [Verrucomicrobiales bacterium]